MLSLGADHGEFALGGGLEDLAVVDEARCYGSGFVAEGLDV